MVSGIVNEVTADAKGALSTRIDLLSRRTEERPSCHAFCSGAFIKPELPVGKLRGLFAPLAVLAEFGSPYTRAGAKVRPVTIGEA